MAPFSNLPFEHGNRQSGGNYLDGQLLIAMPGMSDERFERSVIYLCAHSEDGAMGLILNQIAPHITFPALLAQLNIIDNEHSALPHTLQTMPVYQGGPVETTRGFVLHTPDFHIDNATLPINKQISLTASLDILRAIANDTGPQSALLALGYAGWSAGQLEEEIQANGWLNVPANESLVFDSDITTKYDRALRQIGVEPAMLSSEAGHA